MCKFHHDVAKDIATDPVTGKIDKTKYQIALVALAKWWVEQYTPTLSVDGYNSYELATKQAQEAFDRTGLRKTDSVISSFKQENLPFLREAIDSVVQELGCKFSFTKSQLDKSMHDLYEGNPYQTLSLVLECKTPELKIFHQAISAFFAKEGVEEKLKLMLENNIAKLFQEAPKKVNSFLLNQYERHPKIRHVFNACACGMGASGGFIASHAGCVISPSLSFSTVMGGMAGSAIAMSLSFGITGVGLYLWHKIRGEVASPTERRLTFASAASGAVLALALHFGGAHANHDDHVHQLAEAKVWVAQFPTESIQVMHENAKLMGIPWEEYLLKEYEQFCSSLKNKTDISPKPKRG